MASLPAFAANLLWMIRAQRGAASWRAAARDSEAAQRRVLLGILHSVAETEFAREHNLAGLESVADYQAAVPIRDYDALLPYIRRAAAGEAGVLTAEPILRFGLSSGSTAASKLIPSTASLTGAFQSGLDPWMYWVYRRYPGVLAGKAYWSVTPAGSAEGVTDGGIPIGFDDERAYLHPLVRRVVFQVLAVPPEAARIDDMEAFRYVTLRLLLQEKSLALISVWNPTFLCLLLRPLLTWKERLTRDLRDGTLDCVMKTSERVDREIRACLRRDPRRAGRMEQLFQYWEDREPWQTSSRGRTLYEELWPNLTLISCWADAAAASVLPDLRRLFPGVAIQPKGLLATEAFVSFPYSQGGSALSLLSHFYEFEPVDDPGRRVRLAHELEVGKRYGVIVTTQGGLYRYRLGDVVEVTGFVDTCPLLRFVGRQDRVVDLRGEKLSEGFVRTLADVLDARLDGRVQWRMFAPATGAADKPCYALFIQLCADDSSDEERLRATAGDMETMLGSSYHYAYCRRLGQIGPLRVFVVDPGVEAAQVYLMTCTELGQRLGDIKPALLHRFDGWSRRLPGRFL
jgi:hypothetical protein